MMPSPWRIGWLATLLACSSNTENPEPPPAGGAAQTYPLDPSSSPAPNGANGPSVGGFDESELNPVPSGLVGSAENCLAETRAAERIGLDILVMLDSSGSMDQQLPGAAAGAATKWDAVRQSLEAFVQAPETREIGVGLQYFPQQQMVCDEPLGLCADLTAVCSPSAPCSGTIPCLPLGTTGCVTSASCDAQSYATPAVAISSAPERAAAIVDSLDAIVPRGETPTGPALSGALAHAQAWATQHPERQVVTVLATDGFPTVCAPTQIDELAGLSSAAAQAAQPVKTFVVGVFSQGDLGRDGRERLDALARAGGTEQAFVIETGGNVSLDFLNALDAIRSSAVGCEFGLQAGAALDFERVNLKLTQNGVDTQLFNATSPGGCNGDPNGWYYVRDAQGTPTQIEVCPGVCSTLRQGLAQIDLQIGCATLIR